MYTSPIAEVGDDEILRRVLAGEPTLFEVLMRRHNSLVYRAARGVLRDETEAEDAAQQAWCNAFLHLAAFEGRSKFTTWLVRITINEALGLLRRRQRTASLHDDELGREDVLRLPDPTTADPEQRASLREAARVLERALDELPPKYRSVFLLRESQGLSTAEVADALGLSEEAVKTRLSRGKQMLRDAIGHQIDRAASGALSFDGDRCDRLVRAVLEKLGIARAK